MRTAKKKGPKNTRFCESIARSDTRLNQAVETCLKHIQILLQDRGINLEIHKRPRYRFYVANHPYLQSYFEKLRYSQQASETLAEMTNTLTIHCEKVIILKEKYTENHHTTLHQPLHSLTRIKKHYKRWGRKGLTRHIQKLASIHPQTEIAESFYDKFNYTKIWEKSSPKQ